MRKRVDACRRAGLIVLDLLVQRMRAQRRTSGPAGLGPVPLWQDGRIREEGNARAIGKLAEDRPPRRSDVGADTHHFAACDTQVLQRLEEGFVAPIQAMVAGE